MGSDAEGPNSGLPHTVGTNSSRPTYPSYGARYYSCLAEKSAFDAGTSSTASTERTATLVW